LKAAVLDITLRSEEAGIQLFGDSPIFLDSPLRVAFPIHQTEDFLNFFFVFNFFFVPIVIAVLWDYSNKLNDMQRRLSEMESKLTGGTVLSPVSSWPPLSILHANPTKVPRPFS
jgi:hypothetical protein